MCVGKCVDNVQQWICVPASMFVFNKVDEANKSRMEVGVKESWQSGQEKGC